MSHRNIVLATAIASVLGVPSAVYAAFDLDASSPTSIKVASESNATTIPSDVDFGKVEMTFGQTINAKGAATNPSDEKFIRFDLSAGAKFSGAMELTLPAGSGVPDVSRSIDVVLSTGGDGESFVIFSVKNDASATNITSEAKFEFSHGGVKLADTTTDVELSYNVYLTALKAAAPDSPLTTKKATYIQFEKGFSFSVLDNTLTADVENDFLKFTGGQTYGQLATITAKVNSTNAYLPSGKASAVDKILQPSGSTLTVNGDFSSLADASGKYNVARLFITSNSSNGCAEPYDPTKTDIFTTASLTADKAILDMPGGASSESKFYLCINRDSGAEIEYKQAEYSLDFTPKTQSDITIAADAYTNQKAGSIKRNGTTLDTPYFTLDSSAISRVILSNFGSKDAKFTVKVQSDEGNVVTPGEVKEGVIKAGTILQINGEKLASFSTKQRGSAKFTIVAPPANISGVYQTVNRTSGAVTSIKLIHEGGNH